MRRSAEDLRRLVYGNSGPEREPSPEFDRLTEPHLDALLRSKLRPVDAVPTPWNGWDQVCGDEGGREGFARGWHVTVGAKTGTGKSIVLCNIAANAIMHGAQVAFLSLEMSQAQLETRLLAILSGLPVVDLEQGRGFRECSFRAASRVALETQERTGGGFATNRRQIHSLGDALDAMREQYETWGARLFLVDYIQLAGNPNDPESITEVSHCIRGLSVELNVTTVAASQFNRATSATNERPRSQGLMGGSSLENDSDQVLLIDHSSMKRATPPAEGWNGFAVVDKNRHGAPAEIEIHFDTRTLRMRELWPDERGAQNVA